MVITWILTPRIGPIDGTVTIDNMKRNLTLTGTDNYIDVETGGYLNLDQTILAANQADAWGGISLDGGHTGVTAVEVDLDGELSRNSGPPVPGVDDGVSIGGTLYNDGGAVTIMTGNLFIAGTNSSGYSYWQGSSQAATLFVYGTEEIAASGTFQIDTGTVDLVANASSAELSGQGLNFGDDNPTFLTVVGIGGGGVAIVSGPVTLGDLTTTQLTFSGANNTADWIDVENGSLTLDGTLYLQSTNGQKPTQALYFLADTVTPSILGAFSSITGNINPAPTYTGTVNTDDSDAYYYQVIIQ